MASDILVVDDEADIRELISGILEDEGHGRIDGARSNGEENPNKPKSSPRPLYSRVGIPIIAP